MHSTNLCHQVNREFQRIALTQQQIKDAEKYLEYQNLTKGLIQRTLFCRNKDENLTNNQSAVLKKERKKYIEHIYKNFNYKIPPEFMNKKIMREKVIQIKKKQKEEKTKKKIEQEIKSRKRVKRSAQEEQEMKGGQKRVKLTVQKKQLKKDKEKQKNKPTNEKGEKKGKGKKKEQKQIKQTLKKEEEIEEIEEEEEMNEGQFESEEDLCLVNEDLSDSEI